MITTIYKTLTFDSAHQLKDHNKCGKLHGHTYKIEVWLTGETKEKEWGFVFDFHKIKDYFDQFDHSNIILTDSCEIMAQKAADYFYQEQNLKKVIVRIWETPTAYAEVELPEKKL